MSFPARRFPFWNMYTVLVYRLLVILLLFTLCRIWFWLLNAGHFEGISLRGFSRIMQGGLVFDISAILYTNLLIILLHLLPFPFRYHRLYRRVLKYLFFFFNGLALTANCADSIYYPFTLKRTTASVFRQFQHETNLPGLFVRVVFEYWYAVLFLAALVAAMVFLYNLIRPVKPEGKSPLLRFIVNLALSAVFVLLTVAGGRGGFRHSTRPITISNAGKYVTVPDEMAIVLNTPFCLIRTSEQRPLKELHHFPSGRELSAVYTPVHTPAGGMKMKQMNVVIFILESFATEYIGSLNPHLEDGRYAGYTPFMDSLMTKSRVFANSFANGRKSIDALPAIISSIPSVNQHFVLSHYSSNRVGSLAGMLAEKGYHTSFFHGAPNGSMGFESYANLTGFGHYFGRNEYDNNDDFDGMWGIWDEEFFAFSADQMNRFPGPFFATIYSVSSHHPFRIPDRYRGRLPEGPLPIHRCVAYTDHALKEFFRKASGMPWFENTLFVFTADHASVVYFPEYRTLTGYFRVPILFYTHDGSLQGKEERVAQQTDILPTVLNYLRYDEEYIAFGQDLFAPGNPGKKFAVNYMFDTYQLISGDLVLHFDGKKVIGLYHYLDDRMLENNITGLYPDREEEMLTTLRAFLQQYNNRMIGDSLVAGKGIGRE